MRRRARRDLRTDLERPTASFRATVPPMRYLVTGAAGFIGSHLSEALRRAGARRRRARLLHRLLRRRAEGGERARARDPARSTSRATDRPRRASTGSSTSPASPACAASATSSRPTSTGTCSPRSGSSRRRRATASGSSSRPRRRSTGTPRRTRRRRTVAPRPVSPYGITKLDCEHLARATARSFGLDVVVAPVLQRVRPAPAARHGLHAHRHVPRRGPPVRPVRRRPPVAQLHVRRRRRPWRRSTSMERGTRHLQRRAAARRRRCARRSRSSRSSRDGSSRFAEHPAVPGDQRRTKADTSLIRAELGWEPSTTLRDGLAAQWEWAAARVAAR